VNYELPNVPEDYVHRIGRTGRAGATGVAVSLVSPDEAGLLKDVEKLLRKTIPRAALPQYTVITPKAEPTPAPRTSQQDASRERHHAGAHRHHSAPQAGGPSRRKRRRGKPNQGGAQAQGQARKPGQPSHSSQRSHPQRSRAHGDFRRR
jgi:ATP-dependent RNA helicase RhlE